MTEQMRIKKSMFGTAKGKGWKKRDRIKLERTVLNHKE
jgi:hypothetical protein